MDDKPNPGSDEARAQGCICAVMDNNRGQFPPWPPDEENPDGGWWTRGDCPVHGWE